jgi:renalase
VARIMIVGAGIAGTFAARTLVGAGHEVVVLDKGHAPGGRLATRTINGRSFDHGAQFLTTKSGRFRAHVDAWCQGGVARSWFHGSPDVDRPDDPDGHPRFRGAPTMRSIPEHLANGLDVRLGMVVRSVAAHEGGFVLDVEPRADADVDTPADDPTHHVFEGDAVLLTAPVPQTLALLAAGSLRLEPSNQAMLDAISYDPCIAVLAVPHQAPALPARGAVRIPGGEVEWVTDNRVTGASGEPAVTVHASAQRSRDWWDLPDDEVGTRVIAAARDVLGVDAEPIYVHRWRYSNPTSAAGVPSVLDTTTGAPLAIAGDGLSGGRVEGAALSGLDAAERLIVALAG